MNGHDVVFQTMMKEAMDELSCGKKGWKELDSNTLIMACFGLLTQHLSQKLEKPIWIFSGSVSSGVVWYIVSSIFHIGG